MKVFKLVSILLAIIAIGSNAVPQTVVVVPGAHLHSAKDRHAELKRALKDLQKAREDLMKASRDYGGHRSKAVEAIDNAIAETKQALTFVD
jgi:hypothetical protein